MRGGGGGAVRGASTGKRGLCDPPPPSFSVPFSREPEAEGGGEFRRGPRAGPGGGDQRVELGGERERGGGGGGGDEVCFGIWGQFRGIWGQFLWDFGLQVLLGRSDRSVQRLDTGNGTLSCARRCLGGDGDFCGIAVHGRWGGGGDSRLWGRSEGFGVGYGGIWGRFRGGLGSVLVGLGLI